MATNRRVSLQNRCGDSKSPYVRGHMNNPTAWQLWTPETLQVAKDLNRLLFISIGYSACHWCHVMEHESFENARIAQLLNEHFIPIKIDREERPDIDRQYMDYIQATSGGGGWPLNVFVTPDLEPVFGGTYWPGPDSKRARSGGTSFEQILIKVAQMWKEQEGQIRESGKQIINQLREFAQEGTLSGTQPGGRADDGIELEVIEEAYEHYKNRFDSQYGGFGVAPKFPTPVHLKALLRFGSHPPVVRDIVGDDEVAQARNMATKTLECMAKGGIKDQIGHGFARYSVTRDWNLPHFEKMLYDNAQLLPLYLDAWMLTKSPLFLEMVHDVATYLTTEPMQSSLGGIHASEDADSLPRADDHHKREGAFYVWTTDDFKEVLGENEANVCAQYWGVRPEGNVDRRFDHQGELVGKNTLSVQYDDVADLARELSMRAEDVKRILQDGRQKLLAYRELHRPRPSLDDKIVTSWNGLAIGGLARTGAALSSIAPIEAQSYLQAALRAVKCIRDNLFDPSTNTLRRVYRDGPGETQGFADDYAFLISGLLDLYEATFDNSWLEYADKLQQIQIKLFWDEEKYAFFSTPANQPDILIRTKDAMDNAEPSTNGVSAQNLFRLSNLLNDATYEKMAKQTVAAFEVELDQHPGLLTGMMSSVIAAKLGMKGLILVGEGDVVEAALKKVKETIRPNLTLLRVSRNSAGGDWLRSRNPLLKDIDGSKQMVQLCEGNACKLLGLNDIDDLFGKPASCINSGSEDKSP